MAKGKKLSLVNAEIKEENGKLVIIEKDELEDTEVDKLEADDALKKFINSNHLKITIKEGNKRNMKPRAPIYKYKCGCGTEIKSKSEELHVKCLDCDEEFKKVEE